MDLITYKRYQFMFNVFNRDYTHIRESYTSNLMVMSRGLVMQ